MFFFSWHSCSLPCFKTHKSTDCEAKPKDVPKKTVSKEVLIASSVSRTTSFEENSDEETDQVPQELLNRLGNIYFIPFYRLSESHEILIFVSKKMPINAVPPQILIVLRVLVVDQSLIIYGALGITTLLGFFLEIKKHHSTA